MVIHRCQILMTVEVKEEGIGTMWKELFVLVVVVVVMVMVMMVLVTMVISSREV